MARSYAVAASMGAVRRREGAEGPRLRLLELHVYTIRSLNQKLKSSTRFHSQGADSFMEDKYEKTAPDMNKTSQQKPRVRHRPKVASGVKHYHKPTQRTLKRKYVDVSKVNILSTRFEWEDEVKKKKKHFHEIYLSNIQRKRTEKVLKPNTAYMLSFAIALARIRAESNSQMKTTSCMEAHPKVSNANQDRSKSKKKMKSPTKYGNLKGQLKRNNTNVAVEHQEQKTLAPYYDQNQHMIAFEKIQSSERPKVDIDDETKRLCALLLQEGTNNQGTDATDENTRKWWEKERTLFHGRANSFIHNISRVQGDRRFSPWKGSVVDSVVGVFLTQNVSDHLSSSAFMSLAASYPLKSENKLTCNSVEEIDSSDEEPDICIVELDDNNDNLTSNEKTVEGHICHRDSKTLTDRCCANDSHKVLKQNASKQKNPKKASFDWDSIRKQAQSNGASAGQRTIDTLDSLGWEAIRCASDDEIAAIFKKRGMNNMLTERIKGFLDRLVNDHGSIDLEWLRDVSPREANGYLLSIKGLGVKSVECVKLLTLHHRAFPVDTNVARIAVRLGWVPLHPLPGGLQFHLLEQYPTLESVQKYLWPRLCQLDQTILYELHYHMITFGKVFCTKIQPNCNACPLKGECKHFASAFASTRLTLLGPQDTSIMLSNQCNLSHKGPEVTINSLPVHLLMGNQTLETKPEVVRNCEPIVEIPASPEEEPEHIQPSQFDIEYDWDNYLDHISTINLNESLQAYMQSSRELQEGDRSKALVALATCTASIPIPKLKNVSQSRTEHLVYELPDSHDLLRGFNKREPEDPYPYLLAIWSPGETASSIKVAGKKCNFQEPGQYCDDETCFSCNSQREANMQIVRGTILVPCRTAVGGKFPLNGTYFQVNEVFADHASSLKPIQVSRDSIWSLPRRMVYFGTSVTAIFKGLSTKEIKLCFWRGCVCVRGFEHTTKAPRPLMARLHFPKRQAKHQES